MMTRLRLWRWQHWALLACLIVSIPSLDGVIEDPTAGAGWLRSLAAAYVVVGAAGLLIESMLHADASHTARAFGWALVAGGSLFFLTVSAVWYFWAPISVGATIATISVLRGKDDGL